MSKVVVLGVEGEDDLWLADFEAGSLTKIDDTADDAFALAARSRSSGEPLVRGVKFAIVSNDGEDPAGGHLDRGPSRKPLSLDFAMATDVGDGAASGHYDHGRIPNAAIKGVDVAIMASGGSVSGGYMDRGPE